MNGVMPRTARDALIAKGKRLEFFTIAWNTVEGIVAITFGVLAGSISLFGFGIDSFIEVTSGAALLWPMSVDAREEQREKMNGWRCASLVFVLWLCPFISHTNL